MTHAPSDPPTPRGLGFRPDIQGIRALAVLIVVINHLFGPALPGGFIGVDVFLVVSGYLITALMLREVERSGRISLSDFYARRARRILPAATVVLVVTVLVSLATLALLRTQTVLTDAVWSALFLGNVRMAEVGTDYFAQDAPASPLRHYWSLAVEEQFYLVWPLLLGLAVAWSMRRFGAKRPAWRGVAVGMLLIVVVASLAWSIHATATSPSTAYYSTFTRAHELALGALLAFVPAHVTLPRRLREVLAATGLGAIAWAAFAFSDATAFPGAAALVPVLATVALILAGTGGQDAYGTRLLGIAPAVAVGNWSYSLYLWHWPAIVITGAVMGEAFTLGPQMVLLVGVLVLSWASYRWIENPFRTARPFLSTWGGVSIYPASVAAVLVAVVASQQVITTQLRANDDVAPVEIAAPVEGEPDRDLVAELVQASVAAADAGHLVPGRVTPPLQELAEATADLGACDYVTGTRQLCAVGDTEADRDLVVLGDSLARAMSPALVRIGEEYGYRVHVLGYAGCTATTMVQVAKGTDRAWSECEDFKKWALGVVSDLQPELVTVATSANAYLDPETGKKVSEKDGGRRHHELLGRGWRELFTTLDARAGRVVAISGTPLLPMGPGECLTDGSPTLADCTFPSGDQYAEQHRIMSRAVAEAGVEMLDASRWFCAQGRCPMVVGEHVTLRDTHHVTRQYATEIAPSMALALGLEKPAEESAAAAR